MKHHYALYGGGNAAVTVFFFISGFFFYKKKKLTVINWVEEIVNRHIRLYVIFLIVFGFGLIARATYPPFTTEGLSPWICEFWRDEFSWKEVISHLFLISPFDSHFVDPPLWTLRIELRMVFVLPLLRFLIEKIPGWVVYIGTIVIGFFVSAFFYLNVFMIGMLLRKYFEEHEDIEIQQSYKMGFWIIGILLLDSQYIFLYFSVTVNGFLTTILTSIGTLLIFAMLYKERKLPAALMPVAKLGNLAYPFYLVHFIVILWFRFLINTVGLAVYGILCFVLSIIISYFLNQYDMIAQRKVKSISNKVFDKLRTGLR